MRKIMCNNTRSPQLNRNKTESAGILAPQQSIFLCSNQIITNYVNKCNVRQNRMTAPLSHSSSAYQLGIQTQNQYNDEKEVKQYKLQKVRQQSVQTLKRFHEKQAEQEEQLNQQVKQIEAMTQQICTKASDIMYGRNSSNYYRKMSDLFANNPKELKKLKYSTSDACLRKLECTRKIMQKKSEQQRDKNMELGIEQSHDQSQVFNQSVFNTSSFLENSQMTHQIETIRKKKVQKNNKLKKMIQTNSFQSFMAAKKRNDTKIAFGMFWKQGNENKRMKNMGLFTEKQNTSLFGGKKRRKMQEDQSILQKISKDEKCGLLICKQYGQFFTQKLNELKVVEKQ